MNTTLKSLIFASALLGSQAFATQEQESTYHCTIDQIEITQLDLFEQPGGTQQEIRFLQLTCDEPTFTARHHQAFVTAPLNLLTDLQSKKQNKIKSQYTVTMNGYAGRLVAIDGKPVGPVQPTVRPGTNFDYRRKEIFDPTGRISQIFLQNCVNCNSQVSFVARDTSLFRVIAATDRKRGSAQGDGRGTLGDLQAHLIVQGSVEANQNPGDAVQLSTRDSIGLSRFLLMKKFPGSVSFSNASLVCASADNCSLFQESL